jgi:hypothetical protein
LYGLISGTNNATMKGIKGMKPIMIKEIKVAMPFFTAWRALILYLFESLCFLCSSFSDWLDKYSETPMENPSAIKFANPRIKITAGFKTAPIAPAIIARVVIAPSIPP